METTKRHFDAELSPNQGEIRCECGSLLARLVDGYIELKCRKCKRVVGIAKMLPMESNLAKNSNKERIEITDCCQ